MPESLSALRKAAAECRACPLWQTGTQTVFGEGAAGSVVMFVGEQPGDREDRVEALLGKDFVEDVGESPVRLDELGLGDAGAVPRQELEKRFHRGRIAPGPARVVPRLSETRSRVFGRRCPRA